MKEKLQRYKQDIVQKLISEINHEFLASGMPYSDPDSRAARLIATDVLVEIIERETGQDGRTVVNHLADKIKSEHYEDDFLAALDMISEVLGDDFYYMIPSEVENYFAARSVRFK